MRAPGPHPQVRTATDRSELDACARILAEAFAQDPLMASIWPDDQRRRIALVGYFTATMRHEHSRVGVVDYLTDDAGHPIAVAAWDGPNRGSTMAGLGRTVRAAPGMLSALRDRLPAGISVRQRLDAHEPTDPHWTLVNIGVATVAQKQGHARALLKHRLAHIDVDSLPAHLVCTRAENVALYRRFGFEVSDEFALASGSPLWSMDRQSNPR
ncbi:GNAT family N-acetyltransferase [Williamsia maris]|uniref:Acetyltransferase (GNAT) family protein n=1 Tax=Williamsia maris TaxID=72806 RepID=A0ABT1H939_9NOCA|nr:N-acetyltransferase [Williamsia maris]MCP2174771.1 Acetyltransferase (GNAT) family protein [Williamsia maris]